MLGEPLSAKLPETPLATLTVLETAPEASEKLCGFAGIPV